MTTHLDNATARALSDPRTMQSFATLDRHAASGRFDPQAALRLLRRNARDASRFTPPSVRDAIADRLLDAWRMRNGMIDSAATVRYIGRHGI